MAVLIDEIVNQRGAPHVLSCKAIKAKISVKRQAAVKFSVMNIEINIS
ncbi:hypothetical protein [Daeguia caeni]